MTVHAREDNSAPVEIKMHEWEIREPGPKSPLKGLSIEGGEQGRDAANRLSLSRILGVSELRNGLRIETYSYVGRVEFGNLVVTVLPKIRRVELLKLLRYAYGLRDLKLLNETEHYLDRSPFQDLLLDQLGSEAEELIARGLTRRYKRTSENLSSPRGRIDIQAMARKLGEHEQTLPCIHHPRQTNWLLNRVLLSGLLEGSRATSDLELKCRLRRLASLLGPDVNEIRLSYQVLTQAERLVDRLTRQYGPAIEITRLFLEGKSIVLDEGVSRMKLRGFMFDMNRFFQNLLLRFLRENLSPESVESELPLSGMLRFTKAPPKHRRRLRSPRPDFAVVERGIVKLLLDAKYRDIWELGLPANWLYQLGMYALSQEPKPLAILLYPTTSKQAKDETVEIRHPSSQKLIATVGLRPVNMTSLAELVTPPVTAAKKKESTMMAKLLIAA